MAQAQDPAAIQREIDRTREELAHTLDAIAARVSPKRQLDRGKAKVTEALEQGRAKAKDAGDGVRSGVEARRSGSPSGSMEVYDDGRGGQLYYSSGRELRTDRVAIAAAVLLVLGVVVVRRRRG